MDLLQFISSIISALAWPLTVLVIVYFFKAPLLNVMLSLNKLKYKEWELEFNKLESGAKEIPEPSSNISVPENERIIYSTLEEQVSDIAPRSPQGAILIAWVAVETAIHSTVARLKISPDSPSYRSVQHNLDCLEKYTNLNREVIYTINDLRRIRNKVAHVVESEGDIYPQQAVSYGHTADKIIRILQNFRDQKIE